MDKVRRDGLDRHYTQVIMAQRDWRNILDAALNVHSNIGQFRRVCNEFTNLLQKERGEMRSSKEFKYIEMSLFNKMHRIPGLTFTLPAAWLELRKEIEQADEEDRLLSGAPDSIERTPYAEACKLKLTNSKESGMNKKVFEVKSYVFGQDVSTMSDDQLVAAIKTVEAEIDDLKGIKTKSKKIDARIKDLEAGLKSIVETLDGR